MTETRERIGPGGPPGLQSRCGARRRPGWVRFPHVPATPGTSPRPRGRDRRGLAVAAALGLALALAGAAQARAQEPVRPDTTPPDSLGERPPSAAVRAPAARDTVPPISPVGALVRSLVLPGWGQTAVGRPARGAVYFVAESASLFMVFKTQAKLDAARAAEPPDEGLVQAREAQRENWIVLAGFWAFISGLDAWVSTHFWDFEPEVTPPADGSTGVEATWRVPVGSP